MISLLRNKKYLTSGADSAVYLLEEKGCVVKFYDQLLYRIKKNDISACFNAVNKYNIHTINAAEVLESKWPDIPKDLRLIRIEDEIYTINMRLLPQGDTYLINNSIISIGQKYVNANSLSNYFSVFSHEDVLQHVFTDVDKSNPLSANEEMLIDTILVANDLINSTLKKNFTILPLNIKPVLIHSEKKLDLIVTDLAASIYFSYFLQ